MSSRLPSSKYSMASGYADSNTAWGMDARHSSAPSYPGGGPPAQFYPGSSSSMGPLAGVPAPGPSQSWTSGTASRTNTGRGVGSSRSPSHYFENVAGIGLGFGNMLAETILSHPCIILRRQCQVNPQATNYHLTPFTLVPTMYSLQHHQGFGSLWKGVTSCVIMRGLLAVSERILGDVTGLPKEVSQHSTVQKAMKHFVLKSLACGLSTSFAAASFVETVQSDVASERLAVFECIREGLARMSLDVLGPRDLTRRIPFWILMVPTTSYHLLHHIVFGVTNYLMKATIKRQMANKPRRKKTVFSELAPSLYASFTANMLADALLFPLETVMHRLYLQGTRTIIDNLDSGLEVIPINTRYEGILDCVRSILSEEGCAGFYRGFGALVLQYSIHLAILRLTGFVIEQLEDAKRGNTSAGSDGMQTPPVAPEGHLGSTPSLTPRSLITTMSGGVAGRLSPPMMPMGGGGPGSGSLIRDPGSLAIDPMRDIPRTYLFEPGRDLFEPVAVSRGGMASFPGYDMSGLDSQ